MAEEQSSFRSLTQWFGQLRSRTLFVMLAALFAIDLVIPDPIPLIDEILLGILTLLAARWKTRPAAPSAGTGDKPPTKNVSPRTE